MVKIVSVSLSLKKIQIISEKKKKKPVCEEQSN